MKTRSATYNAIMNTLLTASNLIVALITIPYVSRVLSVERLGDVSFAQSVSTWASALCLLGVNVYGMRECARVRDDARELARVVKELLVIITATTSVVVIGFAVAIFVVPSFASVAPLMWMFLVGTLMLSYGVEWFYQGIERCSYIRFAALRSRCRRLSHPCCPSAVQVIIWYTVRFLRSSPVETTCST